MTGEPWNGGRMVCPECPDAGTVNQMAPDGAICVYCDNCGDYLYTGSVNNEPMAQPADTTDRAGSTVTIEITYSDGSGDQAILETANITLEDHNGELIEVRESDLDVNWRILG